VCNINVCIINEIMCNINDINIIINNDNNNEIMKKIIIMMKW